LVLPDVNVLVYAFRPDAVDHARYREALEDVVAGDTPIALPDAVATGFVRIVTHPRIFARPDSVPDALEFVDALRSQPHCVSLGPGGRHWRIFSRLCLEAGARGNLVPDAYLAALAIESGSEIVTADRGFARFPGLRWRHPLA
jgi:toxin-antitoxin system PIN domain toxin